MHWSSTWSSSKEAGAPPRLYARWVGTAVLLSSMEGAMAQVIKREQERVKELQKDLQQKSSHVIQYLHLMFAHV